MSKKTMTRRALFTSVISLILCCAMLMGTTFAWFTDNVTSGVNQIKAGNLDVELHHSDKSATDEKVDGETKLFDDVDPKLWEPGAVAYENLQVKNVGTLALKYQMALNFENATDNGKGGTLADVLKVAVVEGGFTGNREDAKKLSYDYTLSSFSLNGELKGNENSKTYGVVIYWEPGENDNDYNMKNENQGKVLSIDLGINLFATQVEYESDSFGIDYDKEATLCKFIVKSEEELVAALAEVQNGDTIGIDGNVTWTTGAGIGSTPFRDENNKVSFTLAAVSPDATFTATGDGVGAIGVDGATVTFRNLKIVDESVSYAEGSWEYGYLEFRGNTVFQNCDIVSAIMMEGDSAKFIDCDFTSSVDSEYAVWVSEGDASFEGCYFAGTRGIKVHEAYGSEVGTVIINDNDFGPLSKKPGLAIGDVNADTTIKLTNNLFAGTQPGDQNNYKYESDTDTTTFTFVDENNTVKEGAKVIATAADLLALGGNSQEGEIELIADIDLNGAAMPTIGAAYGKSLTINGNGNTISNAATAHTSHNGMKHHGFFYAYTNSTLTINNLNFEDITIDATKDTERNYGAAIVVAFADGGSNVVLNDVDVKNCKVLNNTPGTGDEAGVYVGYQTGTLTMKDCDSTGCTVAGETAEKTGAFIGMVNGTASLTNCTTDLTIGACNRVAGTLTIDGSTYVDEASFDNALSNGGKVTLSNDISTASDLTGDTEIDLNKNTLKLTNSDQTVSGDLTVKNGTVDTSNGYFDVRSAADKEVVFEGVTFTSTKKAKTSGTSTDRVEPAMEFCPEAAGVKTTFVFKKCTFNNTNVLFEAMSDKAGEFTAIFEECTFNNLGNSDAIEIRNYLTGDITIKDCTFNMTATSNMAIVDALGSSTITVNFEGANTVNGTAATPTDASLAGTVDEIRVFSSQSVKVASASVDTVNGLDTVTVTGIATK